MANEAVLVFEYEKPINFIVSNTVGIEKGTLLKNASPMTASLANGTNDIVAGIAASEKIASDGVTSLAVYRRGIFRMIVSGSASAGDVVGTLASYPNHVAKITATNLSGSRIVGVMMEDATTGQSKLVEVNPTGVTYNG